MADFEINKWHYLYDKTMDYKFSTQIFLLITSSVKI